MTIFLVAPLLLIQGRFWNQYIIQKYGPIREILYNKKLVSKDHITEMKPEKPYIQNPCRQNTMYRGEKKGLQILLSYSQAGPGRKAKQGQEQISHNHVPTFFSVLYNLKIIVTSLLHNNGHFGGSGMLFFM